MSVTLPSNPLFSVNERVLCYHGPLIYEAKVLKSTVWSEENTRTAIVGPHYFVHYKGWRQTWDEWVPEKRMLKLNEENTALQKQLQQSAHSSAIAQNMSKGINKQNTGVKEGGGNGGTRVGARKDGARGTKRGRDEDDNARKPDMKLHVPELLKVNLVDDWEAVTKNNQLASLPRNPTVEELLKEFAEHVKEEKPANLRDAELVMPSFVSGLQCYFDRSLGANLLYRFERPQYAEVRKQCATGPHVVVGQEKAMCAVYGAEHLLRMLVNLPSIIASTTMDQESVILIRDYVNELLSYMALHRQRIFLTEYDNASLQYQNISRS